MKPKNIGFSKAMAKDISDTLNCQDEWNAYPQKEEHWPAYPNARGSYQWIVVVQKNPKKENVT